MKKIFLLVLLSCLSYQGFTQSTTAATYAVSTQSATYTSISGGTVAAAVAADDAAQTGISIGFTFRYCGVNYTTLSANSNGFLSLANSNFAATSYVNNTTNLALIGAGRGVLMPFWDDLDGDAAGATSSSCSGVQARFQTTGTAPNRVFTFEWFNFGQYTGGGGTPPSGCGSFQVKLYETTNIIEFHYASNSFAGNTATIGIANSTTDFFTLTNNVAFPSFSTSAFNSTITTTPSTGIVYRFCPQNIRTAASNGGPYCSEETATLTGVGTGTGATFTWAGPSSYTATGTSQTIPSVTVAASGVYTFTGTIGTCTANQITNMVVNQTPPAIAGPDSVCAAASVTLTNSLAGGSWVSSAPGVGTVSSGGVFTGLSVGTTTITYIMPTGCDTFKTIRVDPSSIGTITGANNVCEAATTTLSNSTPGGTWTTSDATVASIDAGGVVTGVVAGTATITYSFSNWCVTVDSTLLMTVNPLPTVTPITGATSVCEASTTTLSDATTGGVWSSTDLSVASVDATGNVFGVSAGMATISYTITNGCGVIAATTTVTVNPLPNAGTITGTTTVCEASSITLGETVTGGTWSSDNTAVATVDPSTGVVTGVSGGTANISYSVTNGCGTDVTSVAVNVNPLPTAGTITGTTTICFGATTTLADATPGGVWSTADASIASVDATSGNVTGTGVGSTTISYTVTTSCGTATTSTSFTVNTTTPFAGTISGPTSVCPGASISLGSSVSGGTWASSDNTIATVNSAGVVRGIVSGSVTISYTVTTVCGSGTSTLPFTVTGPPAAGVISGITTICAGNSITLTESVSGGTWSTSNVAVVSVSTAGVATGMGAGTARISYTFSNACFTTTDTASIRVLAASSAGLITGPSSVCAGSVVTLADGIAGGTWSSSDNSIASINSSLGIVLGISVGSVTMSYTITDACGTTSSTFPMSVITTPVAGTISGTAAICIGSSTTLVDTFSGGVWSSSNTAVASISTTGVMTGLTAGSATISYTVTNACGTDIATYPVTVSAFPNAGVINGPTTLCAGATALYTDTAVGGTWISSNTSRATVDATGNVTGVSAGLVNIYYAVANACGSTNVTIAVTITSTPGTGTIIGPATACQGSPVTLTDTATGGVWSSSNTAVATVSSTGVVTGLSGGGVTISYGLTNTCGTAYATLNMTISPLPDAGVVGGGTTLCIGGTATLSETVAGGVWSSSDATIATVGSTGVVTALSGGTALISYTVTNSCGPASATATIIVRFPTNAGTITGAPTVCNGFTTTLSDTVTGGTWSTSNAAVASVNAAGVVTGVSTGSATISYTVTDACGTASSTFNISVVNPLLPATISGTTTFCEATTTNLTASVAGGVWNTADSTIATVDTAGVVSGISGGSVIISYTNTNACGMAIATAFVTVTPPPSLGAITGPTDLCLGSTEVMTDTPSGGVWSTSDGSIVVIDVTTGVATPLALGTAIISYTYTGTCGTTTTTMAVTVGDVPASAGTIGGSTIVCPGDSIGLSETVASGVWSSSDNSIATVSAAGVVSGLSPGTADISYTVTNPCGSVTASVTVTVNAGPGSGTISAPTTTLCAGTTLALTDTVSGGFWSSSDASIATVDASGVVTGLSSGAADISYTVSNICGTTTATISLNVLPSPVLSAIIGPAILCDGVPTNLSNTYFGGTWSTSDASVVTINSTTGVATGLTLGTATITYSATNIFGCSTMVTATETVNPSPHAGTISVGGTTFCAGTTLALTDTTTGGTWISGDVTVATVDASGVVTGVSAGTVDISYAVTNSCGTDYAIVNLTVNPQPVLTSIIGPTTLCSGISFTLANTTFGGTWATSDASVATVDPSTGVMIGLAEGFVTISYTVSNIFGCSTTITSLDTVHLSADAGTLMVSGTTLCAGSSVLFSDAVAGGTWSSSDTSVATIDASGLVTTITAGTADISYSVSGAFGCDAVVSAGIIVDPSPAVTAISGPTSMCFGSTLTLVDTTTGGTWSSSDVSIATIDASGVVYSTGGAGEVTLSYTLTNSYGCSTSATQLDTISYAPLVSTIGGPSNICEGSTVTLTNAYTGGVWSSSDASIATIDPTTGDMTGVAAGTATVTYTITASSACFTVVTATETVDAIPVVSAITGTTSGCPGSVTTLSNATAGGSWSSADATIATVSATGDVTALTGGTVTISYTVTNASGCSTSATVPFTVNPSPAVSPITGTGNACLGQVVTLTDTVTGGTWSSSDVSVITIDPTTGDMVGVTLGTATISYTVTSSFGCTATVTLAETVNTLPTVAAITGGSAICPGATVTLYNATAGGTWSSAATSIATVDAATGIVTGVSGGTASIAYTVINAAGCTATATTSFTINPAPVLNAITGPTTVCTGTATTYSNDSTGGTWSSSDVSVATINTAGVVTALTTGTVTISYTKTNASGCSTTVTTTVTVNVGPTVAAISGATDVCAGASITLTDATAGGTWSSSDNSIATVDAATGAVTGVGGGSVNVAYTVSSGGCTAAVISSLSVRALPTVSSISGVTGVCAGSTATLTDATSGGTWSSSNTSIATVGSTGIVTGITTGTATITYSVTSSFGCTGYATLNMTVNPAPAGTLLPTSGSLTLCGGAPVNIVVAGASGSSVFQWYNTGSAITGATNSSYVTDTVGFYNVTVSEGGCTIMLGTITVLPDPNPIILRGTGDILYTGSFATYQWYRNGLPIAGATSNIYHTSTTGSYIVVVADGNGCTDTSAAYILGGGVGVTGLNISDIKLYPNPATSIIRIDAPVKINISILSPDGKVIIHENDATSVDVSNLANGMYMIMIYDEYDGLLKADKFIKVN